MEAPQGFSTAGEKNSGYVLWRDLHNDIKTIAAEGKIRNVVVIGQQGAGKTTFLNTLCTAYSSDQFNPKEKPLQVDFTADRPSHGTKAVTPRPIDLGQGINIVDTWGWTDTNYRADEFQYLLRGHLKARWRCTYSIAEYKSKPEYWRAQPTDSDKMHGCIFIVAADAIERETKENKLSRLDEFYQAALEEGLAPVVLLSKVDLVDIRLKGNNYKNVYTSPEIQRVCGQVKELGFLSDQIFPCKLYHDAGPRSAHVEVTVLRCMKAGSLQLFPEDEKEERERKERKTKRPRNPGLWKVEHVVSWLQDEKLSQYQEKFKDNNVVGSTLIMLDLDALLEMGFAQREALRLRGIIRRLRTKTRHHLRG